MKRERQTRIYATRWGETAGLIALTLLTVLKENAVLAASPGIHDWFDLAYFPVFAAMFIWFVTISISGAVLCSEKKEQSENIEFLGWLFINACAFFAMTVYVMWHRG